MSLPSLTDVRLPHWGGSRAATSVLIGVRVPGQFTLNGGRSQLDPASGDSPDFPYQPLEEMGNAKQGTRPWSSYLWCVSYYGSLRWLWDDLRKHAGIPGTSRRRSASFLDD